MSPKPILVAALLLAPALACAQSYRCVDKAGKVVYTERACETYGMRAEKTIKDMPKGAPLPPPPPMVAKPAPPTVDVTNPGSSRNIMCDGRQVSCIRGSVLQCGDRQVTCEGD